MLETLLVVIASILIAVGIFLMYFLDRELEENKMYLVLFTGLACVALGIFALFYAIPAELLQKKILGLGLSAVGFFLVFKFPGAVDIQGSGFGYTGIIVGLFMLVGGLFLFIF